MVGKYLVGIDVGTTTCRCAVFDARGEQVAWAAVETAVRYPRPRWAEVDPEVWWQGTAAVVRRALAAAGERGVGAGKIAGVGVTGLMHAPVLLDGGGSAVTPAMLWMDQRCAPQCAAMQQELAGEREGGGREGGGRIGTSHTAPKLRWLAETRPEALARAERLLLPKDFVRYRLTGEGGTDPSDAGGTGMFDREAGAWDDGIVAAARVPRRLLPDISPAESIAGRVTPAAAAQTGLAAGTPVAAGGADTFCTRLGAGRLAPGEVCIYLGTAAWIAMSRRRTAAGQARVRGFGATSTTGAALRWARELLTGGDAGDGREAERAGDGSDGRDGRDEGNGSDRREARGAGVAERRAADSYEALTRAAAEVAPGAEGLFCLPHLMGERGPEAEPLAQGALVGLTLRHGRGHVARAVLEGTAVQIRRLLEASAGLGSAEPPLGGLVCGGGAHSALWMQILCDVTGLPLRAPANVEAGVLGAAMLAAAAAGGVAAVEAQERMARPGARYAPHPMVVADYQPIVQRYVKLDRLLMPWFRETAE